MEKKNDGGPAFANSFKAHDEDGELVYSQQGMSLRDYFAGQALVGLCFGDNWPDPKITAHYAYEMAEAMLKERNK